MPSWRPAGWMRRSSPLVPDTGVLSSATLVVSDLRDLALPGRLSLLPDPPGCRSIRPLLAACPPGQGAAYRSRRHRGKRGGRARRPGCRRRRCGRFGGGILRAANAKTPLLTCGASPNGNSPQFPGARRRRLAFPADATALPTSRLFQRRPPTFPSPTAAGLIPVHHRAFCRRRPPFPLQFRYYLKLRDRYAWS